MSERPPAVDLEKAKLDANLRVWIPANNVQWYLADLEATRQERDAARKELEEARAMLKMTVDALAGTAYFIKETDNWESFNEWSNCND